MRYIQITYTLYVLGTFSPSDGLSPCLPCARCPAGIPELTSCSATQDTHCDCDQHFYLWRDGKSVAGLCAACTMCGRGEGVVRLCGAQGNTQCQPCRPGTFSEEKSDIKPCQACSQCSDTEVEIRACQLNSDTLCMGESLCVWCVCMDLKLTGAALAGQTFDKLTYWKDGIL